MIQLRACNGDGRADMIEVSELLDAPVIQLRELLKGQPHQEVRFCLTKSNMPNAHEINPRFQ